MKIINKKSLIILLGLLLPLFLMTCTENHVLPNFGIITVDSDPRGAEVFLNGESKGITPLTIEELLSGNYSIELIITEFVKETISVELNENETEVLNIYLVEEDPKGQITLTSNPTDAIIFLNGTNSNFKTPHTFTNLERGNYDFTLKLNLYDDSNFSIDLNKDETVTKSTRMAIAGSSGGIIINSSPSGATIYVDDFNTGVTPDTLNPIAPGDYTIKLTLDEFKDTTFIATVIAGSVQTLNIQLKGLFVIDVTTEPSDGGTISGAGGYTEGERVNLVATPNTGYNFVSWKEGNSVVSTNSSFSFVTTENRNLVATFELKEYQVEASTNPTNAGSISGVGNYKHGESVELSFTVNDGYQFVNWTENDTEVSTNEVYSFTADGDRTLVANFKQLGSLRVNSDPEGADIYLNGSNTGQKTPHEFNNLEVGSYLVELKLEDFADVSRNINIQTNETTNLGTITLVDITPDVNVNITSQVNASNRLVFFFDFNQAVLTDSLYVTTPGQNGDTFKLSYVNSVPDGAVINWSYAEKISGNWKFIITGTKQDGRKAKFEVTKFVNVN